MKFLHRHTLFRQTHYIFGFTICKMALLSPYKSYGSDVFNGARLMCPMEHKINIRCDMLKRPTLEMVEVDLGKLGNK